jgi:hypothetical protein
MQQGIQSAHAIAELFNKYEPYQQYRRRVVEWAAHHKTIRILDAGSGEKFNDTYQWYENFVKEFDLPHAEFSEPDINNMITAFCFVVLDDNIQQIKEQDFYAKQMCPTKKVEDFESYLTKLLSFKPAR